MATPYRGLSEADLKTLCANALAAATADHTRVNVRSGWRGYTRVSDNRLTSGGGSDDVDVTITSVFGKRVASVTANDTTRDGLADAVRRSEALARIAPEDPEYLPELGPQTYAPVNGYYTTTADMSQESRAQVAVEAIDAAKAVGGVAAGFIDIQAGTQAVATSNGLFAFHPGTGCNWTLTVRTPDGQSSGWAGDEASDWTDIQHTRVAQTASRKCDQWRGKTDFEPGQYTAVLEPTAVGMLMLRMMGEFYARPADEGRSYFSKPGGGTKLGEQVFHPSVTITSDPAARGAETAPFTGDGQPLPATTWVKDGVLTNLAYDRYWANEKGTQPLPGMDNFLMAGGDATTDELIASVERGILITRFWYIRGLNPRIMSYTGLTRDGLFLIEDGKVSRPITNFRFNQSIAQMLQNVKAMGQPVRVPASENSSVGPPIVVPPLLVDNFTLASVSDAI